MQVNFTIPTALLMYTVPFLSFTSSSISRRYKNIDIDNTIVI